jgi:hypothetical protein
MEYNNIRELNVIEIEEVNGGVFSVAAVLLVRATYTAYRTNPAFRSSVNTSVRWVGSTALGVYATLTFTGDEE